MRITQRGKVKLAISFTYILALTVADDTKDRVLQWLSSTNPSSNHNAARKKHEPSTGAWLLRSQSFIEWKNNANSFLWLHGIRESHVLYLCQNTMALERKSVEASGLRV